MSKLINLTGKTFGNLTVLDRIGRDSTGKTTWKVLCNCGKTTVVTGLNLKSGTTKSCGCLKHRKGKDNPKFVPLAPETKRQRKRSGALYKQWRNLILIKCPVCLSCGEDHNLNVHHILGVHEYPHLMYEINNGITLCESCHRQFHKVYGRKVGFTEEDVEHFIDFPLLWLVSRWRNKNGIQDLKKAIHFLELLIELENKECKQMNINNEPLKPLYTQDQVQEEKKNLPTLDSDWQVKPEKLLEKSKSCCVTEDSIQTPWSERLEMSAGMWPASHPLLESLSKTCCK